jgi:hypothetical protein
MVGVDDGMEEAARGKMASRFVALIALMLVTWTALSSESAPISLGVDARADADGGGGGDVCFDVAAGAAAPLAPSPPALLLLSGSVTTGGAVAAVGAAGGITPAGPDFGGDRAASGRTTSAPTRLPLVRSWSGRTLTPKGLPVPPPGANTAADGRKCFIPPKSLSPVVGAPFFPTAAAAPSTTAIACTGTDVGVADGCVLLMVVLLLPAPAVVNVAGVAVVYKVALSTWSVRARDEDSSKKRLDTAPKPPRALAPVGDKRTLMSTVDADNAAAGAPAAGGA